MSGPGDNVASIIQGSERALGIVLRLAGLGRFTPPTASHIALAVPMRDRAGREGWLMVSRLCGTCQSAWREEVEGYVVAGSSFGEAARQVPQAALTERRVRHHFRAGHHPASHWAWGQMTELRSCAVASRLASEVP